jgi:hypothetical protein
VEGSVEVELELELELELEEESEGDGGTVGGLDWGAGRNRGHTMQVLEEG